MKSKVVIGLMCVLFLASWALSQITSSQEKIKIFNDEKGVYENMDQVHKTEDEWKAILTPEQFNVTRKSATERPFKNIYNDNHRHGIYKCIGCGTDLYRSEDKYDSKTGWPSFTKPVAPENVATREDKSLFSTRTEVHCPRCQAHLGHVFDDGPAPTGKRFCMNSAAMRFVESTK